MMMVLKSHSLCIVAVALALLTAATAEARHHKKHSKPSPVAGTFDYYVMSLSWSPEHCAARSSGRDALQCGTPRHYGFVLHGLWPQYENGYPESCSTHTTLSSAVVESMLDVMPSPELVRHEWAKHGTCSGQTPDAYFAAARTGFAAVKIPVPYSNPTTAFQTSVSDIEQAFHGANPTVDPGGMAVLCSGRFLQEVRVCLDKNLHPRACGHDIRDTCKGNITIRPIK